MSPWVVSLPCIPSALEVALGDRSHTQLMAVLSCLSSSGTALLGSCGHQVGCPTPSPAWNQGSLVLIAPPAELRVCFSLL